MMTITREMAAACADLFSSYTECVDQKRCVLSGPPAMVCSPFSDVLVTWVLLTSHRYINQWRSILGGIAI